MIYSSDVWYWRIEYRIVFSVHYVIKYKKIDISVLICVFIYCILILIFHWHKTEFSEPINWKKNNINYISFNIFKKKNNLSIVQELLYSKYQSIQTHSFWIHLQIDFPKLFNNILYNSAYRNIYLPYDTKPQYHS